MLINAVLDKILTCSVCEICYLRLCGGLQLGMPFLLSAGSGWFGYEHGIQMFLEQTARHDEQEECVMKDERCFLLLLVCFEC